MAIDNLTGTNLELLESYALRPLRELALHNAGIKLLSDEYVTYALAKLKEIDDELERRRN